MKRQREAIGEGRQREAQRRGNKEILDQSGLCLTWQRLPSKRVTQCQLPLRLAVGLPLSWSPESRADSWTPQL